MRRRTFLQAVGTGSVAGVSGLAGCTAPQAGGGPGTGEPAGGTTTGAETPTTGTGGEQTTAGAGAEGGASNTVRMVTAGSENYFDPVGLFVESGQTVTFVIDSGVHSSTAYAEGNGGATVTRIPDGAEPWNSDVLTEPGATFEYTFETPGTYDYFCIPHKTLGMVARIVVDEPGGSAEGSMPPDGNVPESATIVEQGSVSYDEFSG